MDWKEIYVLGHRDLVINEKEVMDYVQMVADEITRIFKENNLEKGVSVNYNDNTVYMPDSRFQIKIDFDENKEAITFTKRIRDEEGWRNTQVITQIFCYGGFYKTYYYGSNEREKPTSEMYTHINYELIDFLFKYLLS